LKSDTNVPEHTLARFLAALGRLIRLFLLLEGIAARFLGGKDFPKTGNFFPKPEAACLPAPRG
jgi:hypothetical protein